MNMPITRRSQLPLGGLGESEIMQAIASIGREVAADQIQGIYFRSQISPDIELDPVQVLSGEKRTVAQGGVSEGFLQFAKPAVYLDTKLGSIRIAPWGEPNPWMFPLVAIGSVAGLAVLVGVILKAVRK